MSSKISIKSGINQISEAVGMYHQITLITLYPLCLDAAWNGRSLDRYHRWLLKKSSSSIFNYTGFNLVSSRQSSSAVTGLRRRASYRNIDDMVYHLPAFWSIHLSCQTKLQLKWGLAEWSRSDHCIVPFHSWQWRNYWSHNHHHPPTTWVHWLGSFWKLEMGIAFVLSSNVVSSFTCLSYRLYILGKSQ